MSAHPLSRRDWLRLSAAGVLRGSPHFHHAIMEMCRGVHRLQGRVRSEGIFIIGFHRLGGIGERLVDVADIFIGLGREVRRQLFGPC